MKFTSQPRTQMDTIQTDTLLFKILTEAGIIGNSGGIYTAGERPDNSHAEDIVINNISYEHSTPRRGISNINIHVPDIAVTIDGIQQYKTNRDRLQELTSIVETIIKSTTINGIGIHIETTQVFAEATAHEHYMNIRCSWIIANPYTTDLDITESVIIRRIAALEQDNRQLKERLAALEQAATANQEPAPTDQPTNQNDN